MIPVTDLARTLGLSEKYVVGLCERGRLPAQKVDGAWVIWEDDMDAARGTELPIEPAMDDDPF